MKAGMFRFQNNAKVAWSVVKSVSVSVVYFFTRPCTFSIAVASVLKGTTKLTFSNNSMFGFPNVWLSDLYLNVIRLYSARSDRMPKGFIDSGLMRVSFLFPSMSCADSSTMGGREFPSGERGNHLRLCFGLVDRIIRTAYLSSMRFASRQVFPTLAEFWTRTISWHSNFLRSIIAYFALPESWVVEEVG